MLNVLIHKTLGVMGEQEGSGMKITLFDKLHLLINLIYKIPFLKLIVSLKKVSDNL